MELLKNTKVSHLPDRRPFSGIWEEALFKTIAGRAAKAGVPQAIDAFALCGALKSIAIDNSDGVAAQLLHLLAIWATDCLDQVQAQSPEVLREIAPEMDSWPVIFRKEGTIKSQIVPGLKAIGFSSKLIAGKGNIRLDSSNAAAMHLMEMISVVNLIQFGEFEHVRALFRANVPPSLLADCRALPKLTRETRNAWWKVLNELSSLRLGDFGNLPKDHFLVKLIPKSDRNDPKCQRGSGRPGTQRSRIKAVLKHSFDSLLSVKVR